MHRHNSCKSYRFHEGREDHEDVRPSLFGLQQKPNAWTRFACEHAGSRPSKGMTDFYQRTLKLPISRRTVKPAIRNCKDHKNSVRPGAREN